MNDKLKIAYKALLEPAGITEQQLTLVLSKMWCRDLDFADIYLQYYHSEGWVLEDSIVKSGSFNIIQGAGVRAISGAKTGFALVNDINYDALQKAGREAASIVAHDQIEKIIIPTPVTGHNLYSPIDPLISIDESAKINLLQFLDRELRASDSRVKHVHASLSATYSVILLMNSENEIVADVRPSVHCHVSVVVEANGKVESASASGGWRRDYKDFFTNNYAKVLDYGKEAVRIALLNLEAMSAPAGIMPVVLGPGWPAVLLHEAVGHGLEGDFIRKGSSVFANKLGSQVASPLCTIVDDGILSGQRRGSLNIDDEGIPTQYNILIEKGKLVGFMQDRLNAKLMHVKPTGNGRRESYAHIPLPRMTNTYMLPGQHDPAEIIASVQKGIYAVNFSGGQVDITSGKFVFSTSEAYMIDNGKITYPIKNVTLIGDGPTVLTKVDMVGNDLDFDHGIGVCGKDGQSVSVGVGQPTLKVAELTVGGTDVN